MSDHIQGITREGVYVESPLHYFLGMRSGTQPPSIVIRESTSLGHLIIRGDVSKPEFVAGIQQALEIELPVKPRTSSIGRDARLHWLGPDEWLLLVDREVESHIESKLRLTLTGHYGVTIVTGGQTLINVSGKELESLLRKSSVYDFHPSHFQVNDCVQTTFAQATGLFCKCADGSFDIVIRRSFADYLARWLLDAGAEFGCVIE